MTCTPTNTMTCSTTPSRSTGLRGSLSAATRWIGSSLVRHRLLKALLYLALVGASAAQAQTFNPLAPYGTIWDTSPQLCVQGGNNFVCSSGVLVTGSIASYIYTANGSPA